MKMNMRLTALIAAVMLIAASVVMTACASKSAGEEDKKEYESVAGNCYVLAGMSSEDEEFDEDLIKEMFSIQDLSDYLTIYFGEDDKVKVAFMNYGDEPVEGTWTEENGVVRIDLGERDVMELNIDESGVLSTVYAEDDDEFLITLQKTDEIPERVKA